MKLNRFKKGSEQAYYFGQYPHRYFEVVENINPLNKELCEMEMINAGDFVKIVENVFIGCLDEAAVVTDEHALINLVYKPFLPPFISSISSGKLCVEIQPHAVSEYADISCLSMRPPQYIQTGKVIITTKSYDEELIKHIADLVRAVYNAGTLNDKNVQEKALKLFLLEQKTEPDRWSVGYIPTKYINKKTIPLHSNRIPDSITVDYTIFLSFVIFRAFSKLYVGNLPFRYMVNPGEPEHLGEGFYVIKVENINSFNIPT